MKFKEWLHWLKLNLLGKETEARMYALNCEFPDKIQNIEGN